MWLTSHLPLCSLEQQRSLLWVEFSQFRLYCSPLNDDVNNIECLVHQAPCLAAKKPIRSADLCEKLIAENEAFRKTTKEVHQWSRLQNEVVKTLIVCQRHYTNETGDWIRAAWILRRALSFGPSEPLEEQVRQEMDILSSRGTIGGFWHGDGYWRLNSSLIGLLEKARYISRKDPSLALELLTEIAMSRTHPALPNESVHIVDRPIAVTLNRRAIARLSITPMDASASRASEQYKQILLASHYDLLYSQELLPEDPQSKRWHEDYIKDQAEALGIHLSHRHQRPRELGRVPFEVLIQDNMDRHFDLRWLRRCTGEQIDALAKAALTSREAIRLLQQIGPPAHRALPALLRAQQNTSFRDEAKKAINAIKQNV